MSKKIVKVNQSIILYDDTLIHDVSDDIFNSANWQNNKTLNENRKGRGSVFFINIEGKSCALKHYCRGGVLSKLIYDQYLYLGLEETRSFMEWNLLSQMHALSLPVPVPIAARVRQSGLIYQADLLTQEIPNVQSMGDKIKQELMTKELWIRIGQCLSRFHQQGIVHKDLNIENIQIDANDKVFFLDFDKTRFSKSSPQILEANLRRLRKSILKLTLLRNQDFPDKGWIDLVTATSY